jgi:hypothetical protein
VVRRHCSPETSESFYKDYHKAIGRVTTLQVPNLIRSGEQNGRSGIVRKLNLRHKFAYEIEDSDGAFFSASDDQIE